MPSSGYTANTFVANEQPSTAKWNQLWGNDASFNNGNGFNDNILITRHFATSGLQLPDKTLNPYKFRVYKGSTFASANNSQAVVLFDTKTYDTGSNVDVSTNKGRFTAPVAGFYYFNARIGSSGANGSATRAFAMIYKNGSEVSRGLDNLYSASPGFTCAVVADTIQLAANDYIEIYLFTSAATTMQGNTQEAYFSGFLLSGT